MSFAAHIILGYSVRSGFIASMDIIVPSSSIREVIPMCVFPSGNVHSISFFSSAAGRDDGVNSI